MKDFVHHVHTIQKILLVTCGLGAFAASAQNQAGWSPPYALSFQALNGPTAAGVCTGPFQVKALNDAGVVGTTDAGLFVSLSTSSDGGTFHSVSSCASAVSGAPIPVGASQTADLYYRDLREDTASLVASSPGLVPGRASLFVDAGAAFALEVTGYPQTAVAGTTAPVTVVALDSFGNRANEVTSVTLTTPNDPRVGDQTVTLTDGAGSSPVTLETAGSQALTATTGLISGSQTNITINPGSATRVEVTGLPAQVVAGAAQTLQVTAFDSLDNVATSFTGTVTFTSDAASNVPSMVFLAGSGGQQSKGGYIFTVAGPDRTLNASVGSSVLGAHLPFEVAPAAPATISVTGFPAQTTAGMAGSVTVTLKDSNGNLATNFTGQVRFSSNDMRNPTLPADYTFSAANAGIKTFTNGVVLKQATTNAIITASIITASIVGAAVTGSQSQITVLPAATNAFKLSGLSSPATAGVAQTFTVRAVDAFSNITPSFAGDAVLSSTDPIASFTLPRLVFAGSAGTKTTAVTFRTAGSSWSVTATEDSAVLPKPFGTFSPIAVKAGPFKAFSVLAKAGATAAACQSVIATVEARDAEGNQVRGARPVTVCVQNGVQAKVDSSTLSSAQLNADKTCVSGSVSEEGSAEIHFRSTVVETAQVSVENNPLLVPALSISWLRGGFDAAASHFAFEEMTGMSSATLKTDGSKLTVRFSPTDSCGNPITLNPTDPVSFKASAPLSLSAVRPSVGEGAQTFFADLTLDVCPADPAQPLAVEALLADLPMSPRRELEVLPLCAAPKATLTVAFDDRSSTEPLAAGHAVSARIVIKNEGALALDEAELRLTTIEGLKLSVVTVDRTQLTPKGDSYPLPALRTGETRTVDLQAHVTLGEPGAARLSARIHDSSGAAISGDSLDELIVGAHVVDVGGCGCGAAGGAWPLLLLLSTWIWNGRRRRNG